MDGTVEFVVHGARKRARQGVAERIRRERRAGLSLRQIRRWARDRRDPRPQGRWRHSQVRFQLDHG